MNNARTLGVDIGRRGRRRWVVAAMYASFAAMGLSLEIADATGMAWLKGLAAPFGLACLIAFYLVYQFTKGYAIQSNPSRRHALVADEREAKVRDHAMARGYLVISFLLLFSVGWMGNVAEGAWWWRPRTSGEWKFLFWAVLLLTSSLPQSLIMWNEPDTPLRDRENEIAGAL